MADKKEEKKPLAGNSPGAGVKPGAGGKEKKPRMVTVDAEALARTLGELDEMKARMGRVEAAADVGRLDAFDNKRKKIGPRRYRISTHEGKIITGWLSTRDKYVKEPSGRARVEQEYEFLFEDNTKLKVVGYDNFANTQYEAQVVGEEVKRETDEYGTKVTMKIVSIGDEASADTPRGRELLPLMGKEITLDLKFVN